MVRTFAWQSFGLSSRTGHGKKTFASVSLQGRSTARNADFLWFFGLLNLQFNTTRIKPSGCWTFKSSAFQQKTKIFPWVQEVTDLYVWLWSRILQGHFSILSILTQKFLHQCLLLFYVSTLAQSDQFEPFFHIIIF